MHERLRQHSIEAWDQVQTGQSNPLLALLCQDDEILKYLTPTQIKDLMDVQRHTGDAILRAHQLAQKIRSAVMQV
jgi:adenylosuccinate lyase